MPPLVAAANYADYIMFGAFQWARVVSPFKLLTEDDPVYAWRERLLDAFDASRGNRRAITPDVGGRVMSFAGRRQAAMIARLSAQSPRL
jgi:hypothetical protein